MRSDSSRQWWHVPVWSLFAIGLLALAAGATCTPKKGGGTAPGFAPAAPVGLTAVSHPTPRVTLNWLASTGADSYTLLRSAASGGPYTTLAANLTVLTYNDTAVAFGSAYYYEVRAVNVWGASPVSNIASALTVPAAPTGFAAIAGSGVVHLSWPVTPGADSYILRRGSVSGGPYGTSLAVGLIATNFDDNTVVDNTTYYYVLAAVNAAGTGADSGEVPAVPGTAAGPAVLTVQPADGATGVSVGVHVVLQFSAAMNTASVAAHTTLSPAPAYPPVCFWNGAETEVTLVFDTVAPAGVHADDLLTVNTVYMLTVGAAATDQSARPLAAPFVASFTTQPDITPPALVSITPNFSAAPIPTVTTQIDLLFNEDCNTLKGGLDLEAKDLVYYHATIGNPDSHLAVAWLGDLRTLRVTLAAGALQAGCVYNLDFHGIQDPAGNPLDLEDLVLTTAGSGSDTTAPKVTGRFPRHGATAVSRDTGIAVGFSEPMAPDVANYITLSANATGVSVVRRYEANPNLATVIPTKAWPASTVITVTVGVGAKDASGNALAAPVTFTFTTQAASPNAMVLDPLCSTLFTGMDGVEPAGFARTGPLWELRFKDSVTGQRAALDAQALSSADFSLVETATGIPLKGVTVEANPQRGPRLGLYGSNACPGPRTATAYTLTLNASLKNSQGVAFSPVSLAFTTRAAGVNPSRPFLGNPESQYSISGPGIVLRQAQLQLRADSSLAPVPMTLTVTAGDSPDSSFLATLTGSGGWFRFESASDEIHLTSTGPHQVIYTVTAAPGGFTQTVRDDGYLFNPATFPTLVNATPSTTPTYTWTTAGSTGGDALLLMVLDSSFQPEYSTLLDLTATSFTQPGDLPLTPGTHYLSLVIVKLATGGLGQQPPGMGIIAPLTFTVP